MLENTLEIEDRDCIRDRCGIFGIYGVKNAAEYTYLGLHNLQHRGQESCGIITTNGREFRTKYGMGIVNDIFSNADVKRLDGNAAIGHDRYSTEGESKIDNAQPFKWDTRHGTIATAHNGQIANWHKLRRMLLHKEKHPFKSTSDSELFLHMLSRADGSCIEEIAAEAFRDISPSYSLVFMTKNEVCGVRDPSGVKPLAIGKLRENGAYALASESCAFDIIDAEYLHDVKPGGIVVIDKNGIREKQLFKPEERQFCVFELIYFMRPDSIFENTYISRIRVELGRQLYRESPAGIDVVTSVPDSGNHAALGFSRESGAEFDFGFIRSHYIGRTFIDPTQSIRDAKVKKKLSPDRSVVHDKRIALVDDSIVRGTTMKQIVGLLKAAGAKEVHVRISSPPYRHSCYLGIDTAKTKALIASANETKKVRGFIGADSLAYLSQQGMLDAIGRAQGDDHHTSNLSTGYSGPGCGFCTYCFDGAERIKRE